MNASQKRTFKEALYAQLARVGKALAHGRRLELMDLLAQGERSVEELAHETGMPVASASQHLRSLHRAGLVTIRREGTYAYYRLAGDSVLELVHSLRSAAEEGLADVDRLLEAHDLRRDGVQEVSASELRALMESGRVRVIDVRPSVEYEQGHIADARSIPIDELSERLEELPNDREIVAYCRGPYCVFAHEAVRLLREHDIQARRLRDGYPEWKCSGYPVAAR